MSACTDGCTAYMVYAQLKIFFSTKSVCGWIYSDMVSVYTLYKKNFLSVV